jgi:hypothetical protein
MMGGFGASRHSAGEGKDCHRMSRFLAPHSSRSLNRRKTSFRLLAVGASLVLAASAVGVVFADTIQVDGDIVTPGQGSTQACVAVGSGTTVTANVNLKYNGSDHFNDGTVAVTATLEDGRGSSFITAESGTLTLAGWGGGSEANVDLTITIAGSWATAQATDPGPYKIEYVLTQTGNLYTADNSSNKNVVNINGDGCGTVGGPTNTPPSISADNPTVTVVEGATAGNSGTFSDADSDPVTLSASVGSVNDNLDGTWTWTYNTVDGPADSQTVTITANDGTATTDATFGLVVTNAIPVVAQPAFANTSINCATSVNLGGISFSDAGVIDYLWAVNIDWGDASTDTAYNASAQGAQPGQSHTYNVPGAFTATVGVTDKDGGYGFNTSSNTVTVNQYGVHFLPPFDGSSPSNLITNTMKSGRVVPVKATIFDYCTGTYVTSPALVTIVVKAAGIGKISDNDAIESYADAGASNTNTLTFRWTSDATAPGGGFWIYNLDSKTALNGSAFAIGTIYRIDIFVGTARATTTTWAYLTPVK